MNIMIKIALSGLLLTMALSINAQSKGQIKEHNIKSTTVTEFNYESGRESKKKESFEKFNAKGQVVESIDYDKAGKQKERIEFDYNEFNDCVEERIYNEGDKLEKVYKYTYKGELKQTKEKYDAKGKLLWKKVYSYEM